MTYLKRFKTPKMTNDCLKKETYYSIKKKFKRFSQNPEKCTNKKGTNNSKAATTTAIA